MIQTAKFSKLSPLSKTIQYIFCVASSDLKIDVLSTNEALHMIPINVNQQLYNKGSKSTVHIFTTGNKHNL